MNKRFLLVLLSLTFVLSSCHVGRFVWYNLPNIDDYKKFPANNISKSEPDFYFIPTDEEPREQILKEVPFLGEMISLDEFLDETKTVAFMVIRNDTILYENYMNGYEKEDIVTSFSVAKSFISALIGIAIDEGKVKGISQPVTDFIPELKDTEGFDKITIGNLLDMRTGIKYNEQYYNPFGNVAKGYYGKNIFKQVRKLELKGNPGDRFEYISIATQMLGIVLMRATGQTVASYLEEKIWKPCGMQYDASWSVDSKRHNMEKVFCCLNARTHDFARFGKLYMQGGKWNGKQIVPEDWVRRSIETNPGMHDLHYSNHWWHNVNYYPVEDSAAKAPWGYYRIVNYQTKESVRKFMAVPAEDFMAVGHLGQYIYGKPSKNLLILRFGKSRSKLNWGKFFQMLEAGL